MRRGGLHILEAAARIQEPEPVETTPRYERMPDKTSFMDQFLADRWYQLDDGKPRLSEDDIQRALFGPRGVPGRPDPARMTAQRRKKTPQHIDPGHVA
jgi:hypothetical protein